MLFRGHYLVRRDESVSSGPAEIFDCPSVLLVNDPPADGVAAGPAGHDDVGQQRGDGVLDHFVRLLDAQVQVVVGAGETSLAPRTRRRKGKQRLK